MFNGLRLSVVSCAYLTSVCLSSVGHAQSSTSGIDPTGDMQTRAALMADAVKAESQHRTAEAWLLKTRLQKGDFQDGDRIVVKLLGSPALMQIMPGNDTVTVRAGKLLPLPQMADVPLEGVLRSELTAKLSSHLAKYLRDSSVLAIPLIRLGVFGQVGHPGYYYTAADVLLNDVVMKSGGPTPTADMGNVIIRRGGEVIWGAQDTRNALTDGMSLDRLNLRAGDELFVDDLKGFSWGRLTQYITPIVGTMATYIVYKVFR